MDVFKYILLFILLTLFYHCLFNQIDYFTSRQDPVLTQLNKDLSVIHPQLANVEVYLGDQSYTINKKKIYICAKNEDDEYYQRNMLVYVLCHEYAHILNDEIGHTPKFFKLFDKLLQRASDLGLYDASIPPLTDYCGMS